MASAGPVALNWVDVLEKEFDVVFVLTDTCLANVFATISDSDEANHSLDANQFNHLMVNICDARQHLTAISGLFTQLIHKTITLANNNQSMAKEIETLRQELCETKAIQKINDKISENGCKSDLQSVESGSSCHQSETNQRNLFELLRTKDNNKSECSDLLRQKCPQLDVKQEECLQLRRENISLRRQTLQLQSELFGSRLAAKYLDKELAGRIQQIQLLGRDTKDADHDRLWNQLEAEIHLHRHKTVIRACRANCLDGYPLPAPPQHNSVALKKRQGVGLFRFVTIDKDADEGIGISITGGKEHGVPIIISQIHANTAAEKSGALYVGDAILSINSIDLRDAKHADAANILSNQSGKCVLEVVFVAPDETIDDEQYMLGSDGQQVSTGVGISGVNYPFYDRQVIDENSIESNDYYNIETTNETESLDDSASQANDTIDSQPSQSSQSSPTKRYPGVAKLTPFSKTNTIAINTKKSDDTFSSSIESLNTNYKIETLIE